ncbi:Fdo1p SCDLUD_002650 [Saccharomycodes ludwigii]|uniref:Fdo1p n=1 Tax=Saccharomycodes ludwigii TaxID=36035 RepID=UPI001E867E0F|nr:hypothetical protein SCDLUD_002650 [Saccharomycodes ludwigii]KAH3901167.1 hypothetical protein SCDLUD_002650 [Saccharomycodes ludwigii]
MQSTILLGNKNYCESITQLNLLKTPTFEKAEALLKSSQATSNKSDFDEFKSDVALVLTKLFTYITALEDYNSRLTLENYISKKEIDEISSRFEVEKNLNNQQFEKIKCRLVNSSKDLENKLNNCERKITKYRSQIIKKNREINNLRKIISDANLILPSSSLDVNTTAVSSSSIFTSFSSNSSFSSSKGSEQQASKPSLCTSVSLQTDNTAVSKGLTKLPSLTRTLNAQSNTSIRRLNSTGGTCKSDSNMLNALGLLAAKVLTDDRQVTTANNGRDCIPSLVKSHSTLGISNDSTGRQFPQTTNTITYMPPISTVKIKNNNLVFKGGSPFNNNDNTYSSCSGHGDSTSLNNNIINSSTNNTTIITENCATSQSSRFEETEIDDAVTEVDENTTTMMLNNQNILKNGTPMPKKVLKFDVVQNILPLPRMVDINTTTQDNILEPQEKAHSGDSTIIQENF